MKFLLGFRFSLQIMKKILIRRTRSDYNRVNSASEFDKEKCHMWENTDWQNSRDPAINPLKRLKQSLESCTLSGRFLLRDTDHILTTHENFHLLRPGIIVKIWFKYKPFLVESTDACCGGVSYDSALNLCCDGVLRRKNEASSACCGSELRSKF